MVSFLVRTIISSLLFLDILPSMHFDRFSRFSVAHCVHAFLFFFLVFSIFLLILIHVVEAVSVPESSKGSGSVLYIDERKLMFEQWMC